MLLFGVVWLALLAHISLSPPMDNIEQLTWVHSLEGGYYKHPPLPTWLFALPVRLFGATAWTSYLAGAVCTLGSMALMWRLLARLRGSRYATVALLAALCITYYNGRLNYYNHNVVLMLFSAASAWLCWQAYRTRQSRWWVALGLALGLGALAKYQIAVVGTCVLVFWLQQRGWREPAHREGLLLATLVALMVFSPHLAWLRTHDFGPIRYATESSLGAHFTWPHRWIGSVHWLIDQLFNRALPAWLLLGLGAWRLRRHGLVTDSSYPRTANEDGESSRALLLAWGLVPLFFMPAVGILFGADLQLHWGTPFLLFAVPAAMELTSASVAWGDIRQRTFFLWFAVLQGLLLLVTVLTAPNGLTALNAQQWAAFDSAALAQSIDAPARAALGGRICVVAGPAAVAGALALRLVDHPLVLIDGRLDRSPWVDPQLLDRCGRLDLREGAPRADWIAVGAQFPRLSWRVEQPKSYTATLMRMGRRIWPQP